MVKTALKFERATKKGVKEMETNKLKAQAEEILRLAEENNVQSNFFFVTTFQRYLVQINILAELEKEVDSEGTTVSKEYVKGRKNLYTNPAINAYNRTTDSANKTVTTLLKIVNNFKAENKENETDPLLALINGGDNE